MHFAYAKGKELPHSGQIAGARNEICPLVEPGAFLLVPWAGVGGTGKMGFLPCDGRCSPNFTFETAAHLAAKRSAATKRAPRAGSQLAPPCKEESAQ